MSSPDLLEELRIEDNDRGPGGRRWPWLLGALAGLALLGGGGVYYALGRPLEVQTTLAVSPSAVAGSAAVLDATGYVTARREATVSSKVTGKLAEVLIEEGETVAAGQVLARLDDTDAQAQLELSQARLGAARAQLGQVEAQLDQARRDLRRQQELQTKGLTSQETLENARTQVRVISAQLQAQRGQVTVAQAELRVAQVSYDDTIVRAPFAGVVVAKAAQPGEIVSPISAGGGYTRTGIGTIVDMSSLEIEVDVNEAYINRVRPEQPVQAVLDAYPQWQIPAAVIAIIPTADRSKATVKVRVAIKAKDARILPDMGVRVSFLEAAPKGQAARGVLVPATALVERDGASVAFVVEGDRARRRSVTAGPTQGELRLVENGIAAGERVVNDPPGSLTDGMRVRAKSSDS